MKRRLKSLEMEDWITILALVTFMLIALGAHISGNQEPTLEEQTQHGDQNGNLDDRD